jgi:GNAT superfamily N-acetyltransferase
MYLADAELSDQYHGRGLGKALYRALYAHAANDLRVKSVDGESHSDSARKVHQSLSSEYGFKYSAKPNIRRAGGPNEDDAYPNARAWEGAADRPYNGRWGGYDYDLVPSDE